MKYLVFNLILLIFLSQYIFAQTLTIEEKQRIIEALNDSSMNYRGSALDAIIKYKIVEAKDTLEKKIWNDVRTLQVDYLMALFAVGSNKTHNYALAFLDTLDENPMGNSNYAPAIIEQKVKTTSVLFKLEDYSTYEYVFQMLERDVPRLNDIWAIELLPDIIKNLPDQADRAKSELVEAAFKADIDITRFWALTQLTELFGEETLTTILEVLETDAETTVRGLILEQFLPSSYNIEVNNTLRRMLYQDTVATIRKQAAENLLYRHGTLSDYNFVKEYLEQESDDIVSQLLKYEIVQFQALEPDTTTTTSTMLDTLSSYINQCYGYEWLKDEAYKNELVNKITAAKNHLTANDSLECRNEASSFQNSVNQVYQDSAGSYPKYVSNDGYKFLYYYAQYILDRLPEPAIGLPVKLQDSQGNLLQGGSLQYYDGSWMDAVNNGNGTFNVITERTTVSIRMTYEGGNQQFNNVPVGPDTVTFQTVNATVKLLNSQNELLPEGEVQFYAGSWREFGTIVNGTASKELLPRQYSFRMTYGGANNDKQQNIGTDPVVVFQTVNSTVQLLDSQGNLIQDEGIVQYYAGSWREFGTTSSGTVSKELLPKNYSFRMTHEGVNNDKQQDIGVEDTVSFSTVLCVVLVKDGQNQPVDGAEVKYYSGSWRDIGITVNGEVTKELLPKNLSFRVIHNGVVQNKQQDIGSNSTVDFVVE